MQTEELKQVMKNEAIERMTLLNLDWDDIRNLEEGKLTKQRVDHETGAIRSESLSEEEMKMIHQVEEKFNLFVYYVIQDEGLWPDGESFPRYTLAEVGSNTGDYEYIKTDAIPFCKTLPAYVINKEVPACSELTEFGYLVVNGALINIT